MYMYSLVWVRARKAIKVMKTENNERIAKCERFELLVYMYSCMYGKRQINAYLHSYIGIAYSNQ